MPNRLIFITAAMLAFLGPHVAGTARACDGECSEQTCAAPEQRAVPHAASGMRVSIDPETGQYTAAAVLPEQAELEMMAPVVEPVPEPLPGGGYKLDTRHLRHAFVATANANGLPKTRCVDSKDAPEN